MKLTKEALIKIIKEEINEMAYQPGNAPKGTWKQPKKRYPKSEMEPVPETTPEEDEAARGDFMQKAQFNMIKNMVRGGNADMIDLDRATPFLQSYGSEGMSLLDQIKAAKGL
tara:strand:+ start:255 stop:590 length:336 start_codon:yes stop_codon:yes gene_type:complete